MAIDVGELLSRVAPLIFGGGAVQLLNTWHRRRGEARKLDAESESVAIKNMREVLQDVNAERDKLQIQVGELQTQLRDEQTARKRETRRLAKIAEKAQSEASELMVQVTLLRAKVERLEGEIGHLRGNPLS